MKDDYKDLEELKIALRKKQEHPEEGETEIQISREDLFKSVVDLSSQIKELVDIFKLAGEGMKAEDNAYEEVKAKLDILLKNDQDLAKGLLMVIENQKEREEQFAKAREQQLQQQYIQPIIQPMPQPQRAPARELQPLSPTMPRREPVRSFSLLNTVYPNLPSSPQPVRVMQDQETPFPPEPETPEESVVPTSDFDRQKYPRQMR